MPSYAASRAGRSDIYGLLPCSHASAATYMVVKSWPSPVVNERINKTDHHTTMVTSKNAYLGQDSVHCSRDFLSKENTVDSLELRQPMVALVSCVRETHRTRLDSPSLEPALCQLEEQPVPAVVATCPLGGDLPKPEPCYKDRSS